MCAAASKAFRPDDPLAASLWHLRQIGVQAVYPEISGKGVEIAVIDDGIQSDHPDLAAAYDASIDLDARSGEPDGSPRYDGQDGDNHGTSVAGLIAARADNGIGVYGVAWGSTVTAIRLPFYEVEIDEQPDQPVDYAAAFQQAALVDVANNSWGLSDFSYNVHDETWDGMFSALRHAVSAGRDGLGTGFLFAGGNDRLEGHDTNLSNLTNLHEVIAVAAVTQSGRYAWYSSPGASILLSAPAASVTTDRTGDAGYNEGQRGELADLDYTNDFGGTSAATPVTSGVVALMLEAEPDLGIRDVKEILAYSAIQTGNAGSYDRNGARDWNGGGLHVSHDYGAGLLNAAGAVRLAQSWLVTGESARTEDGLALVSVNGNGGGTIEHGSPIEFQFTVGAGGIDRVEDVEIDLTGAHADRSQLVVTLTSPFGTQSVLLDEPQNLDGDGMTVRLGSTHHWGENPQGTWTLRLEDLLDGEAGTASAATLLLYGASPSADDRYVFTNEYGKFPQTGGPLIDTDGDDTLNLAAMTKGTKLSLVSGSVSKLAGKAFAIDETSSIENAIGGQGKDRLTGNDLDNLLAGRGGNDRLDGGAGQDTALYLGNRDDYTAQETRQGIKLTDRTGLEGKDVLVNIEHVQFADGTLTIEALLASS